MAYLTAHNKIRETIDTGKPQSLDSELEIEDCIALMAAFDEKVDFLKRLKARRAKQIDEEIAKFAEKQQATRSVVLATLQSFDLKSLDFPGIGRVSSRTSNKAKWVVEDDETVIAAMKERLSEDELKEVLKTTPKLVKKELDKVLDRLDKIKELPDGVKKETGKASVSVTVYDTVKSALPDVVSDDSDGLDGLDTLNF